MNLTRHHGNLLSVILHLVLTASCTWRRPVCGGLVAAQYSTLQMHHTCNQCHRDGYLDCRSVSNSNPNDAISVISPLSPFFASLFKMAFLSPSLALLILLPCFPCIFSSQCFPVLFGTINALYIMYVLNTTHLFSSPPECRVL